MKREGQKTMKKWKKWRNGGKWKNGRKVGIAEKWRKEPNGEIFFCENPIFKLNGLWQENFAIISRTCAWQLIDSMNYSRRHLSLHHVYNYIHFVFLHHTAHFISLFFVSSLRILYFFAFSPFYRFSVATLYRIFLAILFSR